ncbi:MAG: LON peptidase substrate-binding domain-containing protein [Burkholderiales bacterium]
MREIPIFPLHTVLFPGGLLPLRIFEQRYLDMTKICLRDNQPFGVCHIREGSEAGAPALPDAVGCTATITEWDMPHLGLFHLIVRGGERFRIVETTVGASGLISAHIELLPPEGGATEVDEVCREVLERVIDKVGAEKFPAPLELDDPAWVAYRLAEILPVDETVKQQLLELQDAEARFFLLRRIMTAQGLINR